MDQFGGDLAINRGNGVDLARRLASSDIQPI
jgi:hypothetical protein